MILEVKIILTIFANEQNPFRHGSMPTIFSCVGVCMCVGVCVWVGVCVFVCVCICVYVCVHN